MGSKPLRVALCLVIMLIVPLCLIYFAFGLPPQYGETYLAALPLKWDRLRATERPRMLLVGGSGTVFDVRCDLLEHEFPDYDIVNFGLYAGLGTTVMLDLALTQVGEGDILIFMPELSGQTLSTFFSAETMWQACDGRPDILPALNADYRAAMLGAFPAFAASKARLAWGGSAPAGDGIYARSSINAYGDMDAPGRERNVMPDGFDGNMPINFGQTLPTDDFLEKVNAASTRCVNKGAALYYRFCPMNAAALPEGAADGLDAFVSSLNDRLLCDVLGDPSESLMESGWFFDTNFHLNESGAVAATAALAADLHAALGDGRTVSFDAPVMPALTQTTLPEGDNSDEASFLYEGAHVTGLTAEGRQREKLTLPAKHGNEPVTSLDAAVFAGNDRLKEVVVQQNIRSIPDGAFNGCTALERIVIENPSPETCSVGAGLLDGTTALVYVPADRVSAYCTSYFWSVHAVRIRAFETSEDIPAPIATPATPRPGPNDIVYLGNGGARKREEGDSLSRSENTAHQRVNTLQGSAYFAWEGHVLLGWSREPDGGEIIGLGSRTEREAGLVLYAQWAEETPASSFDCEAEGDGLRVVGYHGGDGVCVVPESIGGRPVRTIGAGAFRGGTFRSLVLPSGIRRVEDGAFTDCVIQEVTLFDNLREICDNSFAGCTGLKTLRVNAAVSPVYSGSYYDTFADKYDRLLALCDAKKIVLASGSSGRYGYDSAAIDAAFPTYEVVNMGVYAYSNARPQLELIRGLMRAGDILLSAPEFDAAAQQFCVSDRLDAPFWAMMESNYDLVSELDLSGYSCVFDSFAQYQRIRGRMEAKSYGVSPANFDDDGNYYAFSTYNEYGDFILPRSNRDRDERQHENIADYTAASFPPEVIDSMNAVYAQFQARDIDVFFSYSPRSRSSLTEESTPEARAELHEYLTAGLCVPVISELEDYLLSGVYFWNIDSHTSTEGAAIRTERVIEDLKNALAQLGSADGAKP